MTPEEQARLARTEARTDGLADDMSEVKADVKVILAKLSEIEGGKKVIWTVAALLGTLTGWLLSLLFK